MKKYKGYLIDLDGTMYKGSERIPTAEIFIKKLQSLKIPFLFVTNNATKTAQEVADHLEKNCNTNVALDQIYTSGMAAVDYMKKNRTGDRVFLIGEEALRKQVSAGGFELTAEKPDTVLQALDRSVTYQDLEAATLAIRAGAAFIATNPDTNLPTEKGFIPGAGALTAFLEAATQKAPITIGKPFSSIMDGAVQQLQLKKEDVLMVGDNFNTDIMAGVHYGVDTLMVLTGFSTLEDIADKESKPTYIVNDLSEWEV